VGRACANPVVAAVEGRQPLNVFWPLFLSSGWPSASTRRLLTLGQAAKACRPVRKTTRGHPLSLEELGRRRIPMPYDELDLARRRDGGGRQLRAVHARPSRVVAAGRVAGDSFACCSKHVLPPFTPPLPHGKNVPGMTAALVSVKLFAPVRPVRLRTSAG